MLELVKEADRWFRIIVRVDSLNLKLAKLGFEVKDIHLSNREMKKGFQH
jgi:hypothetical protein